MNSLMSGLVNSIHFRGAELIAELMQKEIAEQQAAEREVLNKIKEKMERIKASQQLVQNQQIREPASHYEGESGPVPRPCGSGCVQASAAPWYFLCGVSLPCVHL